MDVNPGFVLVYGSSSLSQFYGVFDYQGCEVLMSLASGLVLAALVSGQVSARSEVRGTVTALGRPVAGASVVRQAMTPDTAFTDSAGTFRFASLSLGAHLFQVRHVGFLPIEFEVTFLADTVIHIDLALERRPLMLDTLVVSGILGIYQRKLRSVGFEERREQAQRSATDATFLSPEDIDRRRPFRLSHLLEGQRSIRIEYANGATVAIPLGRDGRCVMTFWVDGQEMKGLLPPAPTRGGVSFSSTRVSSGGSASLPGLDLISVNDVAAVEIYPSPSGTPAQFQNLTGNCGAIVIWTKQ